MARGFTCVGAVPALRTSQRSPASVLARPSAIWLRQELLTQRKSTLFLFTSTSPLLTDPPPLV